MNINAPDRLLRGEIIATKIRALSRPLDIPGGDDLTAPLDEIAQGPPRATVIVGTALLEDALRWCLCGYLIPRGYRMALPEADQNAVFDNEAAPLNTFHAKIVMGYSLGIYGNITRDDLYRIKRVRNVFAHSFRPITFDTKEVAKECLELRYLNTLIATKSRNPLQQATDARYTFIQTARMMIIHLHSLGIPKKYKKSPMGRMP
jgi:hypothetical protein